MSVKIVYLQVLGRNPSIKYCKNSESMFSFEYILKSYFMPNIENIEKL